MTAALEAVLRRDRLVILGALAAIAALCWAYLIWLSAAPSMAAHTEHGSMAMTSAEFSRWSPVQLLAMFLMWAVMMVGMMTPAAAPMILIYARVARQAWSRGTPFASSAWFALAYFLTWTGFALLATLLQWGLEQALLVSPMMPSATPSLGGALLIGAGIYQWTPLKNACLSQCQSPLSFIQRHGGFRGDKRSAFVLGLRHGAYCIGCCWALMLLLFVAGVMNLLWVAAIAAVVLAEKLIPGRLFQRVTGTSLIVAGLVVLS
jgi:predicted metal-binding membrane protein